MPTDVDPGAFGSDLDTLWVFERAPEAGCEGYEGFQFVGVGTPDRVDAITGPLRDFVLDSVSVWPYATPDVDGDGIDEIALGRDGNPDHSFASILLFEVGSLPGFSDELVVQADPRSTVGRLATRCRGSIYE